MVSIDRFWTSPWLTAFLSVCVFGANVTRSSRDRVVELALARAGLTEGGEALRAGFHDRAGDGRVRLGAEPLEGYDGGAPRGCLLDRGGPQRALQHVGQDLHPITVDKKRMAGGNDLAYLRHQLCDLGEAEGNALERCLQKIDGRGVEAETRDRAA